MRWSLFVSISPLLACGARHDAVEPSPVASGDSSTGVDTGTGTITVAGSCTAASPCVAGNSGCPRSEPGEMSFCSAPGLACYGYGSFSCPETAACDTAGAWEIGCPAGCECAHPADPVEDAGVCPSAPDDGYPQWWSPSCTTTCGACTDPLCRPAMLHVSPSTCGSYRTIEAGCIPQDLGNLGNTCEVRTSDGEVIVTVDSAQSQAGLEYCWEAGLPSSPGAPLPGCPDGGGP
jgi:hypothetical protein